MTVLSIVEIGAPVLRQVARTLTPEEISSQEVQIFIDDLTETMRAANGAGLAANQVAKALRICAVEVQPNNPRYPYKPSIPLRVMLNPEIEPIGDETFMNYEGCLSVPNLRGLVPRFMHIKLTYTDRAGGWHEEEVKGVSAGTYQHEIDHLHGKLFVDRVIDSRSLCTWANFEAHHKKEFVAAINAMEKRLAKP